MKNTIHYVLLLTLFLITACQPKEKNMKQTEDNNDHLAFIGTYTKKEGHVNGRGMGVGVYTIDAEYKNWKLKNSFSEIVNPSYICHSPDHPIVYAVSEADGTIKVLTYTTDDYRFKEIQSVPSFGDGPCYVSTDRTGKYLWVANYGGGNVAQYTISEDGMLTAGYAAQHEGTGPNRGRQEGPHAHYIHAHPTRPEVYAVDLGTDKVYRYAASEAALNLTDSLSVTPGGGCRHLTWHPKGEQVYIINELNGTIEHWEWHDDTKVRRQIISLTEKGAKGNPGSAAIHITEDGQFLYASIRGDFNEVIVLKIVPDTYNLEIIQRIDAGGSAPRFMNLTPDEKILTVALQDDDAILLFNRDLETGKLNADPQKITAKSPVCVIYK